MKQPYYVVSPEYESGGGEFEPPEWGCDVVEVEATSKHEAVTLGVKYLLRTRRRSWAEKNLSSSQNPFGGYRAELARCGHGQPHFVLICEKAVYLECWGCREASRHFRNAEASA